MTIYMRRGQMVGGVFVPDGFAVYGLSGAQENLASQGGDALLLSPAAAGDPAFLTPAQVAAGATGVAAVTPSGSVLDRNGALVGGDRKSSGFLVTDYVGGTLTQVSAGAGESSSFEALGGVSCMRGVLSTTGGAVFQAEYTFAEDVYLGKFDSIDIPIAYNRSGVSGVGSDLIQIWLYTTGTATTVRFQISTNNLKPGVLNIVSVGRDSLLGGATPITQMEVDRISKMRVVVTAGANTATSSVADRSFWIGPMRCNDRRVGRVCIYLDGQYDSQHKFIFPLLDRYGLKANLALARYSLIGQAGYMSEAQLLRHYADGHDFVHHTYGDPTVGYVDAASWPTASSITADINAAWAWMTARGATRGVGHAVVGYTNFWSGTSGAIDGRDALIAQAYADAGVLTLRRGGTFLAAAGGVGCLHPIGSRRSWMPMVGGMQVTSTTTPDNVKAVVDAARQRGQLGNVLWHKAVLDSATPGSLEMRVSDIAACFEYMADGVRDGTLIVDTIANTYIACGT